MTPTEEKLPVERILELHEATLLVENVDMLDGKVAYRLGRLGDATRSITRTYQRNRDKRQNEVRKQQLETQSKMKATENEDEKKKLQEEIAKLSEAFSEEMFSMLQQEEKIVVPVFTLSEFIAGDDKKNREGQTYKKKGEQLVPIKFFSLMGTFIKETTE